MKPGRSETFYRVRMGPLAAALWLLVAACAPLTRSNAVPDNDQDRATVLGMSDFRYWADQGSRELAKDFVSAGIREYASVRASGHVGPFPPAEILAISGGGENGAYGAGILVGWTASGTRPQFKLVTGISTGALTAPFAFLGPAYDAQLQEVYTTLSGKDVLVARGYLAAILDDALADNAPLRKTMGRYVNQKMLDAIAAEHIKGRLLLIGTTNLDARRPVMWNIGKLAASGHPQALKLFQDILIASAAIPGAFPPVMIDVEVGGKRYQEMHVDGGASAQVFVYPPGLNVRRTAREGAAGLDPQLQAVVNRQRHLYVIRNARLDPDWAEVDRQTLSIASRAISSLIQTQGVGDVYRIYFAANRDGFDFKLTYIPESFTTPLKEPFETAYMKELFTLGYELAAKGIPWVKEPPGSKAPEIEASETELPVATTPQQN